MKKLSALLFVIALFTSECTVQKPLPTLTLNNPTQQQINNLYKYGKVWGFLKYYHPEIAKGKFDWDYELLNILPKIISEQNDKDLDSLINKQVNQLGKLTPHQKTDEYKEIKLKPDIDWIYNTDFLGKELSKTLVKVKNSQRPDNCYYIGLKSRIGNPVFENEKPYSQMDFTNDGVKILSLFRYWNIIEYYFPYRYLIDDNWDSVLVSFIPKFVSADDELSYKLTLLELIGKVHDTHANIWRYDKVLEKFWGLKTPPFIVHIIDSNVVVTNLLVRPPGSRENNGVNIGDIITGVNGITIEKLISEKLKYCPASNLPAQYREVAYRLLGTNSDSITLTIQNKDTTFQKKFGCVTYESLKELNVTKPSHKILDGNIGYIYPGSLKKGEINKIMSELKDTKGLIIDFRCYPSDFIVFSLSQYLMPYPNDFVKFTNGSLENPGEFDFTETLRVGTWRENYYKNKIVIIVNGITLSQAEYTTMALQTAPRAIVIGSTTAGADGDVSQIVLPGNIHTAISGIGVYYPNGRETQRVGIVPDIEVKPTVEGIRKGEDELLNKAIEIIKGNK